ncbi:hypothetical protein SRHO_G00335430 [Serrasalmus rhombeus]
MTERKKEKKKKGQAVVSLLRMVLLLGCCRGGTSEHVEDRDKILHDRYRTRTLKIKKKPKKSLFSGALGLFRKSGAEKSGRDNDTDMQFRVIEENGQDTSGEHENAVAFFQLRNPAIESNTVSELLGGLKCLHV